MQRAVSCSANRRPGKTHHLAAIPVGSNGSAQAAVQRVFESVDVATNSKIVAGGDDLDTDQRNRCGDLVLDT